MTTHLSGHAIADKKLGDLLKVLVTIIAIIGCAAAGLIFFSFISQYSGVRSRDLGAFIVAALVTIGSILLGTFVLAGALSALRGVMESNIRQEEILLEIRRSGLRPPPPSPSSAPAAAPAPPVTPSAEV